jgi:hypothetical protein
MGLGVAEVHTEQARRGMVGCKIRVCSLKANGRNNEQIWSIISEHENWNYTRVLRNVGVNVWKDKTLGIWMQRQVLGGGTRRE